MKPTTDPVSPALAARDLVYQLEALRLVDRVTLKAGHGEFIGIIGPNGAGKTTLLRTISGILRGSEGSVVIEGRDLDRMPRRELARILGHVHQIAPYTHAFTSLEIVLMGRYPHLGRFQVEGAKDRSIALEAMRLTETEAFAQRLVTTLSGGERQRVFVARALAQQPRILLLDEPTANLDIHHQLRVLELMRGMVRQGMAAIAAIHDITLAARYCHRLVLMSDGKVVAEGLPHEVVTPATVEAAFHVRSVVYQDPMTGSLTLSLIGPSGPRCRPGEGVRVHVVSGAGKGARLMYELQQAGFIVTAGPLGAGDTDRMAADLMSIEYVPLPAFSPIDDEAHERHLAMVEAADLAVLCDMPVGVNNMRNVEALAKAKRLIALEAEPFQLRDYTGGVAQLLYDSLRPVARCATLEETFPPILDLARDLKNRGSEGESKG